MTVRLTVTVLLVLVAVCGSTGEVFTALARIESVLKVEHELAHKIREYVWHEMSRLEELERIAEDMEQHSASVQGSIEQHLGNPVNAFLLVKRFTSDWTNIVHKYMYSQRSQAMLEEINTTAADLPDSDDLRGAAQALLRLQDTYDLQTSDLAQGVIAGVTDYPMMTAADCFELGKQAYNEGDYYHVLSWMPQALQLIDREEQPTASRAVVLDYLSYATYKQGNIRHAFNLTVEWLQLEPDHSRAQANLAHYRKLLDEREEQYRMNRTVAPPDDSIRNPKHHEEYRTTDDFVEYQRLCRGDTTKVNPDEHRLTCQYKRPHPMFYLSPLKEEIMYLDPFIAIYHHLMTDEEQAIIKELAVPKLARSVVVAPENKAGGKVTLTQSNYRTSQSAWLNDDDHPVIRRLTQRTSALTGLTTDTVEDFQEHEISTFDSEVGNRIATVIFYVAAPESGGATVFPDLGVKLWPEKGSCALWFNLLKNGSGDYRTKHAGCPTLAGSKWSESHATPILIIYSFLLLKLNFLF